MLIARSPARPALRSDLPEPLPGTLRLSARTPAPLDSVCALGGCWRDVPLHVPPLASCAARQPAAHSCPAGPPLCAAHPPGQGPGGGAAAGLQHPPPARPRQGAAYSTAGRLACCDPFLKHNPSHPGSPAPHSGHGVGGQKRSGGGPRSVS